MGVKETFSCEPKSGPKLTPAGDSFVPMVKSPASIMTMVEKNSGNMQYQYHKGNLGANRLNWNVPVSGAPAGSLTGMMRHENGPTATVADGHAERLKLPPFSLGGIAPIDLFELGDVLGNHAGGVHPNQFVSTRAKLWMREDTTFPGF